MTRGSVVAREYGLPAIVGLEKVTERLTTGQLVRVDGSSGVVEILEDASSEDSRNRSHDYGLLEIIELTLILRYYVEKSKP